MTNPQEFRLEQEKGYTVIKVAGQALGGFNEGENSIIADRHSEEGKCVQRFKNKREAIDWVMDAC